MRTKTYRLAATTAVLLVMLPAIGQGATRYVANTGSDGPNCGVDAATACRSITQAIALAAPGDTVLAGPGRYGDLNRNGALGDIPGEETGSPGCGCVLSINKNVIVISTAGAAVTTIDGASVDANVTVLIITVGGEFGRPGKGFTVTETARTDSLSGGYYGHGIVLDAAYVLVRGNQVIFTRIESGLSYVAGILTVNDAPILIEGNLVTNWEIGIQGRGAATISRNQLIGNWYGVFASGGSVVGNAAIANFYGFSLQGAVTAATNVALRNRTYGFIIWSAFTGTLSKNNILGNGSGSGTANCALANLGVIGLKATSNYWGTADGPGPPPADNFCDYNGGTTITSPFAKKPFATKVLKP